MKKIKHKKTKKIGKCLTFLSVLIVIVQIESSITAKPIFEEYNFKNQIKLIENNDIRSPAEFETIKELIITWPKKNSDLDGGYIQEPYYINLVKAAEDATNVNIIVNNIFIKNRVILKLKQNHIPLSNVSFTVCFTNSIWVRDYGPFFIEKNNALSIVDFHYYRKILFSRPIDDLFPSIYGLKYGIKFNFLPNFFTTFQGGNYISDGISTGFVADRIFKNDNPKLNKELTKNFIKYFLGLDKLVVLKSQVIKVSLGGDETGHIDMYAKLIDKDTMIVAEWNDQRDVNYQILEDNAETLKNMGYEVIRIPILRDPKNDKIIWTYTNSLIINGTSKDIVLVPIYNTTEDQTAISIYENLMPDYEIRPINCESIITYYGAIHCTTLTVPLMNY
jgi:agmatine deiminase